MMKSSLHEPAAWGVHLSQSLKWVVLAGLVAGLAGSASAAFLLALEWATSTRESYPWLLLGLPLAGGAVGWVYFRLGQQVEAGNNLLIDEIHDPKKVVPLRMAPLILLSTVISHVFGASVGREGTAVQMGGALADQLTHVFRLKHESRRILLMSGISAGFASVFGTPLAGAVFALEVLAIGRLHYDAILPCFVAAILGDYVTGLWGVHHTHYLIPDVPELSPLFLLSILLAGVIFGLAGMAFAQSTHRLGGWVKAQISYAPFRPMIGGGVILLAVAVWMLWGEPSRYLGLGIPVISEAFLQPLGLQDFLGKFIFTVTSLGFGFKGGEVTPLFFLGATLGNALAPLLHLPFPLLAAVGFVAVFAGAANTPLACTLMAMELFGSSLGVSAGLACVTSYLFSGALGIYKAQRAHTTR